MNSAEDEAFLYVLEGLLYLRNAKPNNFRNFLEVATPKMTEQLELEDEPSSEVPAEEEIECPEEEEQDEIEQFFEDSEKVLPKQPETKQVLPSGMNYGNLGLTEQKPKPRTAVLLAAPRILTSVNSGAFGSSKPVMGADFAGTGGVFGRRAPSSGNAQFSRAFVGNPPVHGGTQTMKKGCKTCGD